ncbi:MAG: superoxide dismutase family protein [Candidatus Babeliales bacterium]
MKAVVVAIISLTVGLSVGSIFYYHAPFYTPAKKAVALINPTKGNSVDGVVTFTKESRGIRIVADIHNLTPGEHGFHIHEWGACNCDDAVCAGDHFNPTHTRHGARENKERHVGDLGNIKADELGNARLDVIDTVITLNGPQSIIGRSVIIHEKADDGKTQPTGNAGKRVACGVVGIARS